MAGNVSASGDVVSASGDRTSGLSSGRHPPIVAASVSAVTDSVSIASGLIDAHSAMAGRINSPVGASQRDQMSSKDLCQRMRGSRNSAPNIIRPGRSSPALSGRLIDE